MALLADYVTKAITVLVQMPNSRALQVIMNPELDLLNVNCAIKAIYAQQELFNPRHAHRDIIAQLWLKHL